MTFPKCNQALTVSAILLAVLAFAPVTSVLAQEQPPRIQRGWRVRVTALDPGMHRQAGRFIAWRADTLVLAADSTMKFPLASLARLEVSRGRDSRPVIVGVVIGAVTGAVIGAATASDPDCPFLDLRAECFEVVTRASGALFGAVLGGLALGLVGRAVGGDRWEEVPFERVRVSVVPQQSGRFALGLSVGF